MKKFKPIYPSDQDISSYRKKLEQLVRRMNLDYERELKPLIKKMSKRQREQATESKEANETARQMLATDAVRFLTAYEVSRMIGVLKSTVTRDATANRIPGAIYQNEDWLIPEDAVNSYAELIGRPIPGDELLNKFNDRLKRLRNKYDDLVNIYETFARQEAERIFRDAKKKFYKQFEKEVGLNILNVMAERGLKQAFEEQVRNNVALIKSLPSKYFGDIEKMTIQSITGQKKFEGGLIKALQDMTGATKKKAKLIARDQSSKAASTYSRLRMQNIGVIGYQWNNSQDKRVAGNPNGLYPEVDKNSKYHGDHWERQGKYYLFEKMANAPKAPDGKPFRQPPPDGSPGMAINCRCYADPVIPD